jgi:ABC-type phosphate transport system substrate-binding protein
MHKTQTSLGLKLFCFLALAGILSISLPGRAGGAGGFVVVVNAANPANSLTADEISKMFFKKIARWKDGYKVEPVDLSEDSQVRESFSQQIHGRPTAAVKAYWQKMIFSGRDVPPFEKASADEVLAYVRANAGAIGYVAPGTNLGSGVKALAIR